MNCPYSQAAIQQDIFDISFQYIGNYLFLLEHHQHQATTLLHQGSQFQGWCLLQAEVQHLVREKEGCILAKVPSTLTPSRMEDKYFLSWHNPSKTFDLHVPQPRVTVDLKV